MSVMGPDGKIGIAGGGWWSPYGDTDEEIQENMKTGQMPNAPDAMRVGPSRHFTGTKEGDEHLSDFLGEIGALGGPAKESYEKRKTETTRPKQEAEPRSARTYLNFEKEQIETLLDLLVEIQAVHRDLSRSEQFVQTLLNEALDRIENDW
jgi:hypothetical protein